MGQLTLKKPTVDKLPPEHEPTNKLVTWHLVMVIHHDFPHDMVILYFTIRLSLADPKKMHFTQLKRPPCTISASILTRKSSWLPPAGGDEAFLTSAARLHGSQAPPIDHHEPNPTQHGGAPEILGAKDPQPSRAPRTDRRADPPIFFPARGLLPGAAVASVDPARGELILALPRLFVFLVDYSTTLVESLAGRRKISPTW